MKTKHIVLLFLLTIGISSSAQIKKVTIDKYKNFKKNQLSELKGFIPKKKITLELISLPTEVIDISNEAKYPEINKNIFTPELINQNCNVLPVNYKGSQSEIGMFFPSNNYENSIFPGAIYQFSSIKNASPKPYTKHIRRNPMNLNTNIFDANIRDNVPTVITSFDYGTISNKWKDILATYINGVTPAKFESDIVLLETNNQIKTFFNTVSEVDVASKFVIPIPKIPVSVNVDNKVSVSNSYTKNQNNTEIQNAVIIKVKQVFYNSNVSTIAEYGTTIFPGVDLNTLEDDLVYVSSVDYGQIYYVVVKSNFTKKEIMQAIANKVVTDTKLGANVQGSPVSGSVAVTTSNESKSNTERVFSSSSTSVQTYNYGGQVLPFGTTIDEVLTNIKNINTKFDANNIGAPISYSLKFVKDGSPVYINTNLSYAVENCGVNLANRKYEVKLTLEKFDSKKVIDNDNSEDIYGNLRLTKFEVNNQKKHEEFIFWEKKGETYDTESSKGVTQVYNNIATNIRKSKVVASNLSFEEISKGRFFLTGKINDKDILNPSYVCKECNGSPAQINLANYVNQINLIKPGESKRLKLDTNDFFELNFYENGDNKSSHIRSLWTVEVTVKE